MNEEMPIIPDIPIVVPKKAPSKFVELTTRLDEQAQAITLLSRAVENLARVQPNPTVGTFSPSGNASNASPPPSSAGGMEMLQMMQAFLQMQNTMKAGTYQDIQMALGLVNAGFDGGDGGDEEDPLIGAITPLIQQWAQGNKGAPGVSPPPVPSPPGPFV